MLNFMKKRYNWDVEMIIVCKSEDDYLFMKGLLKNMKDQEDIVYNIVKNEQYFKSEIFEVKASYRSYLTMMKAIVYTNHKMRSLSEEYYIIYEISGNESE